MPGIEFIASFAKDPLIKSVNAILDTFRNLQSQVQRFGGDIDEVFRRLSDRGQTEAFERRAKGVSDAFTRIVSSIGLAGDAAEDARLRIDKAMDDFANSAEKPKVKFQSLLKDLTTIFDGIKNAEAPLGDVNSTSAISSLEKRLKLEEDIINVLKQQQEESIKLRNNNEEGLNRNKAKLEQIQSSLSRKYNGQAEGFYSESDIALLERGRESVENWTRAWEESNARVQTYEVLIAEATSRTDGMKQNIEELSNVYTGFADTVESNSNKIFISEEVFNRYHELSRTIESLKSQIQEASASPDVDTTELQALQAELAKDQEEFRALDESARHTAEILGTELGTRVSQALAKLYDMNAVVRLNETRYAELTKQLQAAKQELAEAKDPAAITKAREEVDKLQVRLDSASDSLSKFKAEQRDAVSTLQRISKEVSTGDKSSVSDIAGGVSEQVKGVIGNIAAIAGIGLGLNELKGFFDKAKEWRTYFQDIESSMKVFLGSAEKGTEFTEKLQKYAYYNMFEFSDLAAASQQMISYGHNVESIIPRLDQLSNVATGTHGSLMELVDAYNRAKATGVVDARGVQSWAVKGVMIRDVLRDLGETTAGTTITFEQLNKVLDHVTGEGGQFHNLMGEMMNNISAEAGQLEDNLSLMFNEIGEKYESVFIKLLKLGSEVVDNYQNIEGGLLDVGAELANSALDELAEHWQTIVSVLKEAMVTYGAFKAVMIAHNAYMAASDKITRLAAIGAEINAGATTKEALAKRLSDAANKANTASEVANAAATNTDTTAKNLNVGATTRLSLAVKGLTASMMANPFVLVATAIAGIAYACYNAYDGIMTQEKAQRLLNNAAEEYTEKLKEQEQTDRSNIGIIQDKTKSLLEQTKAYRELIAERDIFSKFSKEEIANMSQEQIGQMLSEDNALKEEEAYRKRYEALKELQSAFSGKGAAWVEIGEDDTIDEIVKGKGLGEEFAKELKESINAFTDLSDWAKQQAETAGDELQNYLAKGAETGVVEGFSKGFSSQETLASAQTLLNSYQTDVEQRTGDIQKEIAETEARIAELRKQNEDTNSSRIINDNNFAIQGLNNRLKVLSESLIEARKESAETFQGTLSKHIDEATKKVEELRHQAAGVTGTKKMEIEAEIKKATDERDTWASLSKLIEAGTLDTEVVMKITREVENNELGDETLVEIGKDYQRIESIGQDVATQIEVVKKSYEDAQEAAKAQGEQSHVSFEQMMEDAGLTAEGIDEDFSAAKEHISKDIDELGKKQRETSDESEKHKLQLEIDRKKEQIDYINTVSNGLKDLIKDPYNIKVKIASIIPDPLKKLFNKLFGIDFDEKEKTETSKSERAQAEAEAAQQHLKEQEKTGPVKKTGAQWKAETRNALISRKKELENLLKTELTQADAEKYQKELDQINSTLKRGADAGKKLLAQRAKLLQDQWKREEEIDNLSRKAQDERTTASIAAIKNDAERERREREAQHQRNLRDINDQTDETYKAIYDQRKKAWELAHKDTPYETTEEGKRGYQSEEAQEAMRKSFTDDEKKLFDLREQIRQAALDKENAIHERAVREQYRMEAQAMYDYLKEYGTIQQQKYAIAKEYDNKIAMESDANKKRILQAEKSSALTKLDAKYLASNIDWTQTFSGVGNVLQGLAKETLAKVDKYMSSAEFKSLDARDKQPYREIRQQLVEAGGVTASNPFSGKVWDEIGKAAQRYRDSVRSLNEANAHAEDVRKRLTEAEKNAADNPTDLDKQELVKNLRTEFDEASAVVTDAEYSLSETQTDLRDRTESVARGFQNFNTILGQITSGSLSGFATAVGNIIKKISGSNDEVATNFGELFGEAGKQIGGLVGAILQIIDILGTEPAKFIDDLLAKVADVLEAVLSQLPEIIASAIKGVGNIVGSIFTGLAEGVASLFGGGADNSAYENAVDKWGHILETWEENLKYEKQLMEKAYGGDLLNLRKETMQGLKNAQAAAAEIYRGWAGSGAGWFSHSNGYNVNEDTDWGALVGNNPDIAKQVGVQSYNYLGRTFYGGGSVDNLFNLDWRELEKLKYSNTKFWQSLHGEAQKYLEQFIEAGKAMDEVQQATWEKLTTTTSDNVFDGFLNSLYELANKSEDVFDDISKSWQDMVNKMAINNLVGSQFQKELEKWYEKLAEANKKRVGYYDTWDIAGQPFEVFLQSTDEEYQASLDALGEEYRTMVENAQTQIEQLRELGIINATGEGATGQQSASAESMGKLTIDQGDEIIGRLNAGQIIWQQENITADLILQNLNSLKEAISVYGGIFNEMRALLFEGNGTRDSMLRLMRSAFGTINENLEGIKTEIQRQ